MFLLQKTTDAYCWSVIFSKLVHLLVHPENKLFLVNSKKNMDKSVQKQN